MSLRDIFKQTNQDEDAQFNPLSVHAVAEVSEHLREQYALLLAAILSEQAHVSAEQARLFHQLLLSLRLGDVRVKLFEYSKVLDKEKLISMARLIREEKFSGNLLLDALILLRIDAPLTDESSELIAELASFLRVDKREFNLRVNDAADILGLDQELFTKLSSDVQDNLCFVSEYEEELNLPNVLLELWPSKISQKLSKEALERGIDGGLWVVEHDMYIDFDWSIENAELVFRNNAVLYISDRNVEIIQCKLFNATIDINGSINISDSEWQGIYPLELEHTALNSKRCSIKGSHLKILNARAINTEHAAIDCCKFSYCGHGRLLGGAITANKVLEITKSNFYYCIGAQGGALFSSATLNTIYRSNFYYCKSTNENSQMFSILMSLGSQYPRDVAVCLVNFYHNSVSDCSFYHAALRIDQCKEGDLNTVEDSYFSSSNVYFYNIENDDFLLNCIIKDGYKVRLDDVPTRFYDLDKSFGWDVVFGGLEESFK